ncbi:MAG: copper chaperone PCu(A)C [Pacificimonas sp.]
MNIFALSGRVLAGAAVIALMACDQAADAPDDAPADMNTASELADTTLQLGEFQLILPAAAGRPAALYGTVTAGADDDRLLSISIDGATTELHETVADAGVMRMNEVDGFDMGAGSGIELAQGGRHGMIFGLPATVQAGDSVNGTLNFENAGEIGFAAQVVARGVAAGGMGDMVVDGMDEAEADVEDADSEGN